MKKFFGLVLGVMLLMNTAAAMTFSQPEEIGWIGISQRNGAGGFMFKNENSNNGDYYTGYDKNNRYSYGKGIVQFGTGADAIYFHYDAYLENKYSVKVGERETNNTISIKILNTWIYKIPTDGKIKLYATREWYGSDSNWVIFGTKQNGDFVKYLDTLDITEKYFGLKAEGGGLPIAYDVPKCNGDTIIIPYKYHRGSNGEFRFKWDEAAQWFSIEQIKY